jgi:hypothetical protein
MSKATRMGLVDPAELPSGFDTEVKEKLALAGIGAEDHEWILGVLHGQGCAENGLVEGQPSDVLMDHFDGFSECMFETVTTRSSRLLILASWLAGCGPNYSQFVPVPDCLPSWHEDFRSFAGLRAEEIEWPALDGLGLQPALWHVLIPGLLSWHDVIGERTEPKGLNSLQYWLQLEADGGAEVCFKFIVDEWLEPQSADAAGRTVLTVLSDIESVLGTQMFGPAWSAYGERLCLLREALEAKSPTSSGSKALVSAWLKICALIHCPHYADIPLKGDEQDRIVELAQSELGHMRADLRSNPSACDFVHYQWAVEITRAFLRPWVALKGLLLAFSEMTEPAVCSDLRYWSESELEAPPAPYSRLPTWIATGLYSKQLEYEMESDPDLVDFRGSFSAFCISRLKTKRAAPNRREGETSLSNEDFTEPRPCWRMCYLKAIAELDVNPGGRGHKVLFWLSQNDPDADVMRAAKSVHRAIRHRDTRGGDIAPGVSSRRGPLAAFWWLRQAHLLGLGITIDPRGATRTRDKEIRRTREK